MPTTISVIDAQEIIGAIQPARTFDANNLIDSITITTRSFVLRGDITRDMGAEPFPMTSFVWTPSDAP